MANARGYDVSDYQSSIPADAQFVFIKASEGASTEQSGYTAKLADARHRGMVVGHYHFLHAENDVTAEVEHFCSVVGQVPAGELLALDFEPYGQGIDDATATAKKNQWLAAVKQRYPHNRVGLYADLDWWRRTDDNCGDYLWIADYGNPAASPAVQHPWVFHQFTDSPLDTDVYNGTLDQLRTWATIAPSSTPQWQTLLAHLAAVPEQVYEHWVSPGGWDNRTQFGQEYGEDGVSWCVIFDWDMYHDVGLDSSVPKTDNVSDFTAWAKQRGQWSEYPSIGAWVNFGNGAHTEIVTGFDADNVYTKGGNSIQAGAADNGQGNGVWSHQHARRDSYVVGYFAPHFPDGVCPPTADPQDPRGGQAVTSWRGDATQGTTAPVPVTPAPAPQPAPAPVTPARYQVTINGLQYGYGAHGQQVTEVGRALVARGFGSHYQQGPGPDWSDADTLNYADYQRSLGYSGSDADGVPGASSLQRLLGYLPSAHPTVSLSHVVSAAHTDPGAAQGHLTYPGDVRPVQDALVAEGLLDSSNQAWGRGSFGTMTVAAYAAWQRRLGYSGSGADGIPGHASLTQLGGRHGFTVTS